LLVAGAAAAVVAPAATIRLAPQAEVVGPKTYDLTLTPDVLSGTLQSKTTGHATGKYIDRTAASGVVVFQNFSGSAVEVPAGVQVAAGGIVFATTEAVTVPRSTINPSGAIRSGDQAAAVAATSPGPAGNVGPGAINRVVDPRLDARLQDHPEISQPRVTNPEATAGGKEASGPQIKKEDVDAAAAALRKDLESQLAKVLGDQAGRLSPASAAPTPVIGVAKGLIGTRDRATFELSGTLAYDHRSVQIADVEAAARDHLASDAAAIPAGTELLADTVRVTPGEVTVAGDRLSVPARVTAQSAPRLDPATVRNRVAGLSADAARSALTEYGTVDLNLWPGWVRTVPSLSWRIEVIIDPVRRT
ncbi:MAG: baseplate J/gp47 family protein, partial [Chloroflexota bacterium]|nr:baseplate J/gp47 family protein [Chloroflexota bacterium]